MTQSGRPLGGGRRVATFPAGRKCAAGDCATILSIYNADLRCSVHAGAGLADKDGAAPAGRER